MSNYINRVGETIGTLQVDTILRYWKNEPVYGCTCTECGTKGVPIPHNAFKTATARCTSSTHGRLEVKPLTRRAFLEQEAAEEQKRQEETERPQREAEAALNDTHKRLHQLEKEEVAAGRPDPGFEIPESAKNLSMSNEQALKYAKAQAGIFVSQNPDYFPTPKNHQVIADYLRTQGVDLPTAEIWKIAWGRCRLLDRGIEERPPQPVEPVQEPQQEQRAEEVTEEPQAEELTDGFDIQTGEPRKFSQREIWKMSSTDLRRAFRMWGNNLPRLTRSRYQ